MKTNQRPKPLMNKKRWHEAKLFAQFMAIPHRLSDQRYENREVNLVALQSMIEGWIMAQPYYHKWHRAWRNAYPRDDMNSLLGDFALQVASDVMIP